MFGSGLWSLCGLSAWGAIAFRVHGQLMAVGLPDFDFELCRV